MTLASPDVIVTALRDYGLTVVEHPGWRTRGTKHPFDPFAQLFHHDALSEKVDDARALTLMVGGRPDLPGPLCNGWIDSSSDVTLVAYGNANHAGRGEADVLALLKAGQPPLGDARIDPDGDGPVGNPHLWGWECRNAGDGTDVWEQLDAMERAGAALADACGWSPMAIAAHREWTKRKPDPAGIDMHQFRADVARIHTAHLNGDDMAGLTGEQDELLRDIFDRVTGMHQGTATPDGGYLGWADKRGRGDLRWLDGKLAPLVATQAATTEALRALAVGQGVDFDELGDLIQERAEAAVRSVLGGVDEG